VAVVLCTAATLAPASAELAGYEPGLYAGTTDQGERISFRAGESRLRRLQATLFADCKDGQRQRIALESGRAMIVDDRFDLELTGDAELVVRIGGRFRADAASGRIEASLRPPGTACAGVTRWRADRA
jgi:hypothetical protein